ncbi:MAG: hypothetical protein ACPGVU_10135 [Limisphaerales bacterium]
MMGNRATSFLPVHNPVMCVPFVEINALGAAFVHVDDLGVVAAVAFSLMGGATEFGTSGELGSVPPIGR